MIDINIIQKNISHKNTYLSSFATLDQDAIRLKEYNNSKDIRLPFFKDASL